MQIRQSVGLLLLSGCNILFDQGGGACYVPYRNHLYLFPMKTCIACGMPFEGAHANDIGLETAEGPVCKFDSQDGKIKNAEDIFEGGIQFFMFKATDGDRDLAERLTRKNMKSLTHWQKNPFALLDGPEATDAEFGAAMAKL